MNGQKINDYIKTWSPIIFGVVMFYISFVKLEQTVSRLDKVVENLTIITTTVSTDVKVHSETLRNHEIRLNKVEDKL